MSRNSDHQRGRVVRVSVRVPRASRAPKLRANNRPSVQKTSLRTVVKGRFVSMKGKNGKITQRSVRSVKGSAMYYAFRPNEDGLREYRPGFTVSEEGLKKEEVMKAIDESKAGFTYRLIMSPGVEMNREELQDWTRSVLERLGYEKYVAFAHAGEAGHTPHAHAHVLLFTDEKIDREGFYNLRKAGDDEAKNQLRHEIILHREMKHEVKREIGMDY